MRSDSGIRFRSGVVATVILIKEKDGGDPAQEAAASLAER
jgi:hypothetical protein